MIFFRSAFKIALVLSICEEFSAIASLSDVDTKLFNAHFQSRKNHINQGAIEFLLGKLNGSALRIVETGTSAWGFDSTRFWDKYVDAHGGNLISIDKRPKARQNFLKTGRISNSTQLITADSVKYLQLLVRKCTSNILHCERLADLFFFDSWDVDWMNPSPAAAHGLLEFKAIQPMISKGQFIFVDDTPVNMSLLQQEGMTFYNQVNESSKMMEVAKSFYQKNNQWPGKGAYILNEIASMDSYKLIYHHYSIILEVIK